MDTEQQNGSGSGRRSSHVRPLQRRASKKSTSKDRHGRIYPDTFPDASIRTVTPDSLSDPANNSPMSEPEHLSTSSAASPRTSIRSKTRDLPQRDFSPIYSTEDESPVETKSLRVRSRTTTLDDQRSELSPSLLTRTRNRLGSLTTSSLSSSPPTASNSKTTEDSISSIGFPSIVQSPTLRTRAPKLPSSPSFLPARTGALTSPLSNADASKILQLMKTTCGRMHGILFFRTSSSAPWTSGYCAINVSTGSLIYQAKGEPALARTLIPDLRSCRVRTLYDTEAQSPYLSVSTHSAALGVHLRPHVIETFDSWLAALLCWQPIRPKGVHNKMTKPQAVAIGDRRPADRRRNSESTIQKDAAIIKVGKMLLWDKQSASGVCYPPAQKRISTFKQQRALSHSWKKVSCTLQENGHMKIFTETDVDLIYFIQLSQLSRCAIQQLEPSVLQDEYCIALYPQYTAHSGPEQLPRPIYLSLESRILFEVWFVLLRAFTIPELYGPKLPSGEEQTRGHSLTPSLSNSLNDMFRIERLLSVRLIEAKMTAPGKDTADANKNKKPGKFSASKPQNLGHYYAEVLLDGEVRAKTAVRSDTAAPFWREDFNFYDLPPVLSSASVVVKTMHPTQKDWTLVSRGPFPLDRDDNTPMSVLGDVEVTSQDATYGTVDLRLDDMDQGAEIERWWPILDEHDEKVGEILMKVQLEETVVLMSQEYAQMSELLHSFPNGLTVHLAHLVPGELRLLSENFLNIFQVSGQVGEWIMALVEDEIDGIHRDTTASRLRYTSRIHSNDSYESAQDRELLVRDLGKSATVEANLLFRGNSLLTKALDMHMRRLGKEYLEETVGANLRDIDESDPDCEIDPNRVARSEDLERNWRNLIILTSNMWKTIANSASRCPAELRHIFRHIRACAEDRYGDFLRSVTYSSVSGFLFLRFFCPAILNPKLFGLLKEHPRPRAQRTLTLIAKALQGLANLTTFGHKEPWMEPMNRFLISHRSEFKEFVDAICSIPAERPAQIVNPSYATPIQIFGRLPPSSREGFPSLPFLIDNARSFAVLIRMWLGMAPPDLHEIPDLDENVLKFHTLCLEIQQRTRDCLNAAEQAERPNGSHEVKWEELIEQIEKSGTFYDESSSKANTPSVETAMTGAAAAAGSNRNSIGYFAHRPPFLHRSTDVSLNTDDTEEEALSNPPSATWDQTRPFLSQPRYSEPRDPREARESVDSSHNSSTYSLDNIDSSRGRQLGITRDAASSKHRFLDFVTSSRRKARDRDSSSATSTDVGPRNEVA